MLEKKTIIKSGKKTFFNTKNQKWQRKINKKTQGDDNRRSGILYFTQLRLECELDLQRDQLEHHLPGSRRLLSERTYREPCLLLCALVEIEGTR